MGFDGDISQMGKLEDRIADLANIPSRASAEASKEIANLIELEFADGSDPYGKEWQPLSEATLEKGREPPPLTDTWDLRSTIDVQPMRGAGISITLEATYAPPHQTGWHGKQGSGPARPILPDRDELPETWQEAIESAIERELYK